MKTFKLLIFIFGFCTLSYAYPDIKIMIGDSKSITPSVYKGGSFRILKNCFYSKNKYVCEGYKGINDYSFYMKNPENQTKILNALKGINYEITYTGFVVPKKI